MPHTLNAGRATAQDLSQDQPSWPSPFEAALSLRRPLRPTPQRLIHRLAALCAQHVQVRAAHVLGPFRGDQAVVLARQLTIYLAHVEGGLAQAQIARLMQRHRSTVAHACRTIEDRRDDPRFDAMVQDLAAAMRRADGRVAGAILPCG